MYIDFLDSTISKKNEKILLINIVGILEALKVQSLSINEAERFLFSPHMITKLKAVQCSAKIIDIVESGCELEDIASILPDSLLSNINILQQEALKVMKEYQEFDKGFWI